MLSVAQISFYLDPEQRSPEELLRAWPSLVDVAEAAASGGVHVCVVQACASSASIQRNGVTYRFIVPDRGKNNIASNFEFRSLIAESEFDAFHVHGSCFPADTICLAGLAPNTPILIQDHANRVPRFWRRAALRRALAFVDGTAFCAREQALPFVAAGLLAADTPVFVVPESTSRFVPGNQNEARTVTQTYGDPSVLWVGHLDGNKDPLTVLKGIAFASRRLPDLHLWCCFAAAPLMREVQRQIDAEDSLRGRVHLLGRVPHQKIELLMRAADLFVLGSHREGSGYSLMEALACGLWPVVTDIPSFRALTGNGGVGRLWRCGDAGALAEQLLVSASELGPETRQRVRAHFDNEIALPALGRKLASTYAELIATSHARRATLQGATFQRRA